MKKTLFPALAAALVLAACGTKTTGQAEVAAEAAAQQVVSSDIAYVQVEAVLAQCDLYKNEGVALQEKTEKAQKSWAQREQNLQAEAAQLQQKYEKGLITSRDAQAQQESIQKKVASYQSNAQKEAQTLDEENYVFTNRAQDLLHHFEIAAARNDEYERPGLGGRQMRLRTDIGYEFCHFAKGGNFKRLVNHVHPSKMRIHSRRL